MNNRTAWGIFVTIAVFAIATLIGQWFSDNYTFKGMKIVKDNPDPEPYTGGHANNAWPDPVDQARNAM